MATSDVKGNQKGCRKSYRFRRVLVLGTLALLLVSLVFLLTRGASTQNMGSKPQEESERALASEEEEEEILSSEEQDEPRSSDEQEEGGEDDVVPDDPALLLDTFPRLTYGTAWKEENTADLVYAAIRTGFRHIDTACQPRHYNEPGVGEGWTSAAHDADLTRQDIWLQTKFTSLDGQDPERVPYDAKAPLDEQVRQSFAKSLENLQTSYLDSWIMHSPEDNWDDTLLVWRTMESFVDDGRVRQIGISNLYEFDGLQYLYEQARIKPKVVQNRFYRDSGYDVKIRQFCQEHDIEYQSFWTLGANTHALQNEKVKALAAEKDLTPETLMYAFCMAIGITPLDGTTSEEHMNEDLDVLDWARSGDEIFANHEELTIVAEALGIPDWSS